MSASCFRHSQHFFSTPTAKSGRMVKSDRTDACLEPMSPASASREQAMQISKIVTDGNARDEALKRRNAAVRETLGIGPASKRETKQPDEPKPDEKSSE